MSRFLLCAIITALVALGSTTNVSLAGPYWERLPTDSEIQQAAERFTVPNRSIVDSWVFKYHNPTYSDDPIRANGVGLAYRVPNPDYDPANADQPDLECGQATLNWWPDRGGWVFVDGGGRRMCFSSTDTRDVLVSRFLGTNYRLGWIGEPPPSENRPPRLELQPPENPELVLTQEYGVTYKYCFHADSYDDDKDQVTHEWFLDGQQVQVETVQVLLTEDYSVASSGLCWLPLSQGSHTVTVEASDSKGGTAEKEYSFTMRGQWVHVRMTRGQAQLHIGGEQYDLEEGVNVSITEGIRSGKVSITCWAGTTVYLVFADGSKLYFDCRSPSVMDEPGGGDLSVDHSPLGERLEIGPGNVRIHVKEVKIELFEAAGWPGGKLGTEFEIDVKPNGTVTVYTFDGVVWFADPQKKKTVHIRAGETSTGVPGSVPSDPKPFDPNSFERWWEGQPPPPSGTKTIEQALDTNNNKIIDDFEMLQALQYWIKQQPVPGTNKTIDDLTMLSLLQKWIKGTPVR